MNKDKIIALHNSLLDKLRASIEGTDDFKEGPLVNPQAPCLIRSAIADAILIMRELEDVK